MELTSGWDFSFCSSAINFQFALGVPLDRSWEAGLGLEILPKTIAFSQLDLSPVGCTNFDSGRILG